MARTEPLAELDARYSSPDASPTTWSEARRHLEEAEVFWLSTVRPDGRPHATSLISVWVAGALHFCTGAGERKAMNLAQNAHCILTTGCNALGEGIDIVVEGEAERVRDGETLRRIAEAYESKYGKDWHFDVGDGVFVHEAGEALVFAVRPTTAFAFTKGTDGGQTRWRFAPE